MSNIIQFKKPKPEKGIILSGVGNIRNEHGEIAEKITDQDLMYYALYWDRITITQLAFMMCGNDLYDQFKTNGVLEFYQNQVDSMHSSQMQTMATQSLIDCLNVKKQQKNVDWLIFHNLKNSFNSFVSEGLIEKNTIRVELAKCLPVPSTYVPVDSLLQFKLDYSSELETLHYSMKKTLNIISSFDDDERAFSTQCEVTEFSRALEDYQLAFSFKYPNFSLKSLATDIRNNKSSLLNILGVTTDVVLGAPLTFSGIATISTSLLNIAPSKQNVHQLVQNNKQFHYISSAIDRGIIVPPIKK